MNMIVNSSDLVGYEAEKNTKEISSRAKALKKLVAAWESKQGRSAKKLGGLSLLAVSLAACNSEDTTPFAQSDIDAAVKTATDAIDITSDNAAILAQGIELGKASVPATDITSDNAAILAQGIALGQASAPAADITSDNAAVIAAALTDADGVVHASVDAAKASVDITSDNATAIANAANVTLQAEAARVGMTGYEVMTNSQIFAGLAAANDAAAISAAISTASGGAYTSATTLYNAYDTAANPSSGLVATANQDTLTGTSGNDIFTGIVSGNNATGTTIAAGDSFTGGDGADTLSISMAGASAANANISISAVSTSGIETISVSNFETTTGNHTIDTSLMSGFTTLKVASSSATGDNIFSNLTTIPAVELGNGNADSTFTFAAGSTVAAGTNDTATVTASNLTGGTLTWASIENFDIASNTAANTIAALSATQLKKVTVSGDQNLTITGALDFAANGTAALPGAVVDATNLTGNLTISTTAGEFLSITGGSGDDTVTTAALNATDVINLGDGTDTVVTVTSETAALTGTTNVEKLSFVVADIGGGVTNTISGLAVPSATTFIMGANTAADGDVAAVAFTNLDDGDTVQATTGGADDTAPTHGVTITTAPAVDTATNSLNILLSGIGAVTSDASNDTGLANIEADEMETIAITAGTSAAGVTANGLELINVALAKEITVAGAGNLNIDSIVNTAVLTKFDASSNTGALTLTGFDASNLALSLPGASSTVIMSGLNASDTLTGGAGTADSVTGLAVTGLTATTGKLNSTGIENLILQTTGVNTIDASLLSSGTSLILSGNHANTQTITNMPATGVTIQLGEATGAGVSLRGSPVVAASLADSSGAADRMSIKIENDSTNVTAASMDVAGVETADISVSLTDTNNAGLTMTEFEATTINVTGGIAGAELNLGTLDNLTTNVDLTGYLGEVIFAGSATVGSGMTVDASSSAAADDFTTGAFNDTITIGSTGAVDVDVDGAGGTGDTLNLTVATGFINTANIDNIENINITVASGNDIKIGDNANEVNGLAEATNITLTGGNSLSTFRVGDNAAVGADTFDGTTLKKFDASNFSGNIALEFGVAAAGNILTDNINIDAGALTTDEVQAYFHTSGADVKPDINGVETLSVFLDSNNTGGETFTIDLASAVGLTTLAANSSTSGNTIFNVDGYNQTTKVQLGATQSGTVTALKASSQVVINAASATGSSDTALLHLVDSDDSAGTINIDAAGIETLTVTASATATESHTLDLAGVAPTAGSNTGITFTGGIASDGVIVTAVSTGTNSIDASGFLGTFQINDRASTATTIKGGSANDTIRMENAGDILEGNANLTTSLTVPGDTLNIVSTAVLGGINIDLSSTTDQITSMNSSANPAIQTGFESVDASSYTGFGAYIQGSNVANTITGTGSIDQILLGGGADRLVDSLGKDVVDMTETVSAADKISFTPSASSSGMTITGFTVGTDLIEIVDGSVVGTATKGYTEGTKAGGTITAATSDNIFVITDAVANNTGAGIQIALAAIHAVGGKAVGDGVTVIAAASSGNAKMWFDAAIASGDAVEVAEFVGVGVADLSGFATGNFTVIA